jgi:hypothetical protein
MGKNIGFVSTRFAGTDGVTLESSKWSQVLENIGHSLVRRGTGKRCKKELAGSRSSFSV